MGLYILVPLSVVLVFLIGLIFWWSVRSGQYDDLEGPGFRLLMDDKDEPSGEKDDATKVQTAEAKSAGPEPVKKEGDGRRDA